jgi:hypothetical protein
MWLHLRQAAHRAAGHGQQERVVQTLNGFVEGLCDGRCGAHGGLDAFWLG